MSDLGLFEHAEMLVTIDPRRSRQANLRRAVSAAYYALFHTVTQSAAALYSDDPKLAALIARRFDHGVIRDAAATFAAGRVPAIAAPYLASRSVPFALQTVCQTVIELQEARHSADYDAAFSLTRLEAAQYVRAAREAVEAWSEIRADEFSRLFLGAIGDWKAWSKSR